MTGPGDRLNRAAHVARWCSTSCVDQATSWPKVSAFYLRSGEDALSTNWLEYYSSDRGKAVNSIRDNYALELTVGGRFVVLSVGEALDSVDNRGARSSKAIRTPEVGNPSHASIRWDDMELNHQVYAAELHALITSECIYPGKLRPSS